MTTTTVPTSTCTHTPLHTGHRHHQPLNRHQGIAVSETPTKKGTWRRICTASTPCLPPGVKSGALLLDTSADDPGYGQQNHLMFAYDLRNGTREV